ncbi:MAG: PDZ domain-containing protein [Planctomycetaceae bacterium]|nr:PDZ domain-containing protein [Planctomycetaceae bacterium]
MMQPLGRQLPNVALLSIAVGLAVLLVPAASHAQQDESQSEPPTAKAGNRSAATAAPPQEPGELELPATVLAEAIQSLTSPEYQTRQQATARLQQASPAQLESVADSVIATADAEAARRFFDLLEQMYIADDPQRTLITSAILERASQNERFVIAEEATDILTRNWQRRIELTVAKLKDHGIHSKPENVSELWPRLAQNRRIPINRGFFNPRPDDSDELRIVIDNDWQPGDDNFQLFMQLSPMSVREQSGDRGVINFYLIDGHPLTDNQVQMLKESFGDRAVVNRGPVCLGIFWMSQFRGDTGCLVDRVQQNSSAAVAGIRGGDLITELNGNEVRDFETLVDLLREFSVGDEVTMTIQRGAVMGIPEGAPRGLFPMQQTETLELKVRLKGWY